VFATVLEANYINKKEDIFASYRLSAEDKKHLDQLKNDPEIGRKVS
jgi:DNA replication licensing factor MCM2